MIAYEAAHKSAAWTRGEAFTTSRAHRNSGWPADLVSGNVARVYARMAEDLRDGPQRYDAHHGAHSD